MERLSIARDNVEEERLATIDSQISGLQRQQSELTQKWTREKAGVTRLQEIKNQIDSTMTQVRVGFSIP